MLAAMRFTDVTSFAGLNSYQRTSEHRVAQVFAGNLALGDNDGDVDRFVIDAAGVNHLLRNDHGRIL